MSRFAALALVVFCALLLFCSALALVGVARGELTFGTGTWPEYVCLTFVCVAPVYGLYAGGKALLRPGLAASRPMRAVGWFLAGFGLVGLSNLLQAPQLLAYPVFVYGPAGSLVAGLLLLLLFRRPAAPVS